VVELLRDLQARHRLAYLFISHDLRVVRALAHRIIVLKDGRVVEVGEAERLTGTKQVLLSHHIVQFAGAQPFRKRRSRLRRFK